MDIAGVAIGAGLTYWLGVLNRRHQEAREDATRWHETRLKAYLDYANTAYGLTTMHEEQKSLEERRVWAEQLKLSFRLLRLVGSAEVINAANDLIVAAVDEVSGKNDGSQTWKALTQFEAVARRDLSTL